MVTTACRSWPSTQSGTPAARACAATTAAASGGCAADTAKPPRMIAAFSAAIWARVEPR